MPFVLNVFGSIGGTTSVGEPYELVQSVMWSPTWLYPGNSCRERSRYIYALSVSRAETEDMLSLVQFYIRFGPPEEEGVVRRAHGSLIGDSM